MVLQNNGARFPGSPLDYNDDNNIDDSDKITLADNSKVGSSGLKSKQGILFKPTIVEGTVLGQVYLPGSDLAGEEDSGTTKRGKCMKIGGCKPPGPPVGPAKRVSWRQLK